MKTDLENFENHQLLDELRKRGLVICAFSVDDVISGQCPDKMDNPPDSLLDDAGDWLQSHAEWLEDRMTEAGNAVIGMANDPIGQEEE